jgi:DnaJ-class molecular chaperone
MSELFDLKDDEDKELCEDCKGECECKCDCISGIEAEDDCPMCGGTGISTCSLCNGTGVMPENNY